MIRFSQSISLIGIVFKPIVGLLIDRLGERLIMVTDGLILACVCIGYGFALHITSSEATAKMIVFVCFVADNLLFSLGTAREVYASRLVESPQELTSTLSLGVSINHIASMVLPIIAGRIWLAFGYESVFIAGAALALTIAAVSLLVPPKRVLRAHDRVHR